MKNISLYLCLYHLLCFRIIDTSFYYNNYFAFFVVDCSLYFLMYYIFFTFNQYKNIIILVTVFLNTFLWFYNEYVLIIDLPFKLYRMNFFIINTLPFLVIIENEINKRYFKE